MPFDQAAFARTRPWLYHLTARTNLPRITGMRLLVSAATLYDAVAAGERKRARRRASEVIRVGADPVHIRDQAPLHRGNMALSDGWEFEDFVEHLNGHVFFWPGGPGGPIEYGRRHFSRYENEDCAVLAIPTAELFAINLPSIPLFCRHNSGSPRCAQGRGSPRGPRTFVPAEAFPGTPAHVVEVVFPDEARLPLDAAAIVDVRRFVNRASTAPQT